jgi:pimeloyl-ACP methyl ester carboxylesterase/membrane protease YdiL (CAAX protease family)
MLEFTFQASRQNRHPPNQLCDHMPNIFQRNLNKNPFIEPARAGNNRWWTFGVTLLLLLVIWGLWSACVTLPAILLGQLDLLSLSSQSTELPLLVISLVSFAGIPPALWLGLRFFHHRSFKSLVLPAGPFRWHLFFLPAGMWIGLSLLTDLILSQLLPGNYIFTFQAGRFFPYLLAALLLFPVQVASEELIFRAYLTQAVGVKTNSFAFSWLLPALLFGLMHGANPEIFTYGWGWMLPVYIGLGLLLGWLTLRTAGLEAALGLHLANNLYASMAVSMAGAALSSPALFTIHTFDPRAGLVSFLLTGGIFVTVFEILRNKKMATALLACILLISACVPASAVPARTSATRIQLKDCVLSRSGYAAQVSAQCGTLEVLENPDQPSGRKIMLNVAVVKAQSSNPAPDPVFLLAGGPGQAASEAYLPILGSLDKISFKHDLVLLDQRGTGQSNPLSCGDDLGKGLPLGRLVPDEDVANAFKACIAKWDADPHYYTTAYFVNDLEAVRMALGYGQIDLLGVSYGTRSALAYLKAHPDQVRALVLDGVVPPGWVLGATLREDAQRSMDLIFARCASQSACAKTFPDLKGDLEKVLLQLNAKTVTVTIPDPVTSKDIQVEMNDTVARGMLRLISYSSDYAALIPYLVHSAAQGDLRPLAAQYAVSQNQDAGLYPGLFYAVVCSEDTPYLPANQEAVSSFAAESIPTMKAVCQVYPSTKQPASDRNYPTLKNPALIISGEADPVTPPANGAAVASLLPNSKQIVVKGMGHGNSTEGCIPNLIRQLFEEAAVDKIDTSCVERSAPPSFFTSPVGPEP